MYQLDIVHYIELSHGSNTRTRKPKNPCSLTNDVSTNFCFQQRLALRGAERRLDQSDEVSLRRLLRPEAGPARKPGTTGRSLQGWWMSSR